MCGKLEESGTPNNMDNLYHICITSHDEVMFRSAKDHIAFVNCMAIALYRTGTILFVDSEMSDHVHISAMTSSPLKFISSLKERYVKYFNKKYHRTGPFGDRPAYILKLEGAKHILAAWSYILRNGLHHGLCSLAYEYPYSTVSHIFSKPFGRTESTVSMQSRREMLGLLPRYTEIPESYRMDENGMFCRESFTRISQVEIMYTTPRAFAYFMNRLSGEEWANEQLKDGNGCAPVTIDSIEQGLEKSELKALLTNEYGKVDYGRKTDEDLCGIIDGEFVPRFGKSSVYQLDISEKDKIASALQNQFHVGGRQLNRCLYFNKPFRQSPASLDSSPKPWMP